MVDIINKLVQKAESALGLDNDKPPMTGGGVRHTPFIIQDGEEPKSADTFLGALGKIGGIEALGSATKGLNIITKTAAAGGPGLTNLINSGAEGVMKTVMGPSGTATVLDKINRINPSQVNKAVSQSNRIIDDLKNGDFTAESVPKYAGDFANVIKTGLRILKGFGKAPEPPAPHRSMHNYAQDLVDRYGGVKLPFRFVVTFQYREECLPLHNVIVPSFLVKTCDRPQVEFDSEDINMYNIRTKVIKKTTFNPINMAFYDDQLSHVLTFCNMYLNMLSPTTNYNSSRSIIGANSGLKVESHNDGTDPDLTLSPNTLVSYGSGGTIKLNDYQLVEKYGATLAALPESTKSQSLLQSITIYHLYQGGGFCDIYKLINPKIIQMQMDQFNSAGTDGNAITLTWHYDTYSIQTYVRTDEIYDVFNNELVVAGVANQIRKEDLIPGSETLISHNSAVDDSEATKQAKLEAEIDNIFSDIDKANASKLNVRQLTLKATENLA